MKKITCLIGTNNKFKISALKDILESTEYICEVVPVNVDSGVRDAPYNDETFQGAMNRVHNLTKLNISADIYVGLETGITRRNNICYLETWCYVKFQNEFFSGYSFGIEIPKKYEQDVWDKSHQELCDWVDARSDKQDLIYYFTNKKMDRSDTFRNVLRSTFISAGII